MKRSCRSSNSYNSRLFPSLLSTYHCLVVCLIIHLVLHSANLNQSFHSAIPNAIRSINQREPIHRYRNRQIATRHQSKHDNQYEYKHSSRATSLTQWISPSIIHSSVKALYRLAGRALFVYKQHWFIWKKSLCSSFSFSKRPRLSIL